MEPTLPNIGGSSRFSSVVGDVKNVVSDVANLMKSAVRDSTTLVNNLKSAIDGYKGGSGGGGGGGGNGITNDGGAGGRKGTTIFGQPLPKIAEYAMASTVALPGANAQVQQNYFATYSGAYGYGNGNLAARYDQAQQLQARMFGGGTGLNTLDASRAMATGQSRGIGVGLSNYGNLAMGVAGMSNFTPGVGLEGTMSAYASLQRPQTVNMMRMIGITARDPLTGQMKSYTEIANQLWNKINSEKSVSRAITKNDLATSLQPGNSLAIMLDAVAGNDGVLRSQLEAALYAKASGAKDYSREEATRTGFTTRALASQANRTAQSFDTLAQTSRAGALGVEGGNNLNATLSQLSNVLDSLTQILKAGSAGSNLITTLGGGGNGLVGGILGKVPLLGPLLFGGARAEGGSTQGNKAYVVGEKGPELFVPSQNGTVVPNNKLQFGGFAANGVDTKSGNKLSDAELSAVLKGAGFSNIATAMSVVRAESGGRTSALNPNANTGDYSMGLFQINMIGDLGKRRNAQYLEKYSSIGYKGPESLYDPAINARIAYDISKGGTDFTKAWVNTSRKLGLTTGGQITYSGESHPDQMTGNTGQTYADMIRSANPQAAAMAWGGGGGGSTNNNFGGVTIVIQADKNPTETAKAVKEALTSDQIARKAAQS